jgi:hypothetical protein
MPAERRSEDDRREVEAELRDSPVAWFALLELSRRTGNRGRFGEARRELARLGVHVTFAPPGEAPGAALRLDRRTLDALAAALAARLEGALRGRHDPGGPS